MKRVSSLRTLTAAFPSVDPANLAQIRKAWRAPRETVRAIMEAHAPKTAEWVRSCFNSPHTIAVRRRVCDELLETYGVEHAGVHCRSGEHVYYCNAGDTYNATLIFHGNNAYVGCWGDLVERRAIREARADEF